MYLSASMVAVSTWGAITSVRPLPIPGNIFVVICIGNFWHFSKEKIPCSILQYAIGCDHLQTRRRSDIEWNGNPQSSWRNQHHGSCTTSTSNKSSYNGRIVCVCVCVSVFLSVRSLRRLVCCTVAVPGPAVGLYGPRQCDPMPCHTNSNRLISN